MGSIHRIVSRFEILHQSQEPPGVASNIFLIDLQRISGRTETVLPWVSLLLPYCLLSRFVQTACLPFCLVALGFPLSRLPTLGLGSEWTGQDSLPFPLPERAVSSASGVHRVPSDTCPSWYGPNHTALPASPARFSALLVVYQYRRKLLPVYVDFKNLFSVVIRDNEVL